LELDYVMSLDEHLIAGLNEIQLKKVDEFLTYNSDKLFESIKSYPDKIGDNYRKNLFALIEHPYIARKNAHVRNLLSAVDQLAGHNQDIALDKQDIFIQKINKKNKDFFENAHKHIDKQGEDLDEIGKDIQSIKDKISPIETSDTQVDPLESYNTRRKRVYLYYATAVAIGGLAILTYLFLRSHGGETSKHPSPQQQKH
jgi:transposase